MLAVVWFRWEAKRRGCPVRHSLLNPDAGFTRLTNRHDLTVVVPMSPLLPCCFSYRLHSLSLTDLVLRTEASVNWQVLYSVEKWTNRKASKQIPEEETKNETEHLSGTARLGDNVDNFWTIPVRTSVSTDSEQEFHLHVSEESDVGPHVFSQSTASLEASHWIYSHNVLARTQMGLYIDLTSVRYLLFHSRQSSITSQ